MKYYNLNHFKIVKQNIDLELEKKFGYDYDNFRDLLA